VADAGPAGNLGRVGAGVDAELGGLEVASFIGMALVVPGFEAGGLGEEVGAAAGETGELGNGGVVLGIGEGPVPGVAGGGAGDAGGEDAVMLGVCHQTMIEYVFDFCR
jgi:hypothetical protein